MAFQTANVFKNLNSCLVLLHTSRLRLQRCYLTTTPQTRLNQNISFDSEKLDYNQNKSDHSRILLQSAVKMFCERPVKLGRQLLAIKCDGQLRRRHFSTTVGARGGDSYSDERTTHFGYRDVGEKQKKDAVLNVFHSVADSYDLMNDAMSLGVHRVWKDQFMKKLDPGPTTKLLDVAGGTGDIAFRFLDHVGKQAASGQDGANVTVFDINASMLKVGESRAEKLGHTQGISWVEGDAQDLPFEDNTFDCYTIAFGIRNVVKIDLALREAYRVLRPGGRFMCLEFSKVHPQELESLYDLYSFQVIPPMGKILAGDWDSYQYLVESIRKFPDQETFAEMIVEAGFSFVNYEDYTFGVAAMHSGFKL